MCVVVRERASGKARCKKMLGEEREQSKLLCCTPSCQPLPVGGLEGFLNCRSLLVASTGYFLVNSL